MHHQPNRNLHAFEALNAAAAQAAEDDAEQAARDAIRKTSAEMGRQPSFITDGHYMAFQALASGQYREHTMLLSCYVNEKPGVLIVAHRDDPRGMAIQPLFLALGPGVRVTSLTGEVIYDAHEEARHD